MFTEKPLSETGFEDLQFQKCYDLCKENFAFTKRDIIELYGKIPLIMYVLFTGYKPTNSTLDDYFSKYTEYDLISRYLELYTSTKAPSKLGKYEVLNDYIEALDNVDSYMNNHDNYEKYKERRSMVTDYIPINDYELSKSIKIERVDTHAHSQLNQILVTEMNRIQPQLTGYFFEYLMSWSLGIFVENQTYSPNSYSIPVFQPCAIGSFLRKLANKDLLPKGINTGKYYKPSLNWFDDEFRYLLYCAILHMNILDSKPNGDYTTRVLELIDFINVPEHMTYIEEYRDNLITNHVFNKWNVDNDLKHGVKIQFNDKLQVWGEIDFKNSKAIYDIKCSRYLTSDNYNLIRQYLYQTVYYALSFDKPVQQVGICNLMTNQLYLFDLRRQNTKPNKTGPCKTQQPKQTDIKYSYKPAQQSDRSSSTNTADKVDSSSSKSTVIAQEKTSESNVPQYSMYQTISFLDLSDDEKETVEKRKTSK